jgi:hypothetical protein
MRPCGPSFWNSTSKPFQKRPGSRFELFTELGSAALCVPLRHSPSRSPLEAHREFGLGYHVELAGHHYSVPLPVREDLGRSAPHANLVEGVPEQRADAVHITGCWIGPALMPGRPPPRNTCRPTTSASVSGRPAPPDTCRRDRSLHSAAGRGTADRCFTPEQGQRSCQGAVQTRAGVRRLKRLRARLLLSHPCSLQAFHQLPQRGIHPLGTWTNFPSRRKIQRHGWPITPTCIETRLLPPGTNREPGDAR